MDLDSFYFFNNSDSIWNEKNQAHTHKVYYSKGQHNFPVVTEENLRLVDCQHRGAQVVVKLQPLDLLRAAPQTHNDDLVDHNIIIVMPLSLSSVARLDD